MKKKRKRNWLINIVLVLLLVVGLALVFNNQIKNWLIQRNGDAYSAQTLTSDVVDKNLARDTTFDFDAVESASLEAVLNAQMNNKDLPVIGAIALPDVSINLPIFKGLSNIVLLIGAGTMKADQVMGEGNYALASHRTIDPELLFSPLENTQLGDTIYLTDMKSVFTYEVTFKKRVAPTDVQLIDDVPDKKLVTLVTCGDMDAATRIIVQGELREKTPIKDADDKMLKAFQLETKTLG